MKPVSILSILASTTAFDTMYASDYGISSQCFVCGSGDFFEFANMNVDECSKIIGMKHLRDCPGAEDVCKTTVTREVYYETDKMGNLVNTTVETFDRSCATREEQRFEWENGKIYIEVDPTSDAKYRREVEEVYCSKAGCNHHLATEYPEVAEKYAVKLPLVDPEEVSSAKNFVSVFFLLGSLLLL